MPWEKSFDTNDAIKKATNVFWAKGYETTSLADLLKAIGINKGSFYNAFGSKKSLFIQSLDCYDREHRRKILDHLESLEDPVLAINTLFDTFISESISDCERKGCMFVNTALDLPNHDKDIEIAVKKGLKDTELFFKKQLTIGRDNGSIPAHVDVKTTAKGLLALIVGLRVLARGVFDKASLYAIKAQAVNSIK
tara:strand:- start:609 stop:1190 length:582 start_codon:yes stop_codon:yes gene_type:complete